MLIHLFPLLAPVVLIAVAVVIQLRREMVQRRAARWGEVAALMALFLALAMPVILIGAGAGDGALPGVLGHVIAVRVDVVSAVMLVLVAVIGWVVARYARTYLDGEPGQRRFAVWLLATLAAVQILVLSGSVVQFVGAWIATSLCLHRLLLFYPERIGAQRAAYKKFVTARLGDAALIGAAVLLVLAYGTT
ncbi:MAG: oxidoreductase, partial [Roseovarius sp.]